MPSTMTHAYIAKDVYKNLDNRIKNKLTSENIDDLITFSSGFDILYFYKIVSHPNNKIIRLGGYCHHNKVNEFFINLTNQIRKSKDINQFMFLMGLITHYVADSTIHPYVNYKASLMIKKNFTNQDGHFLIEAYLDNYLINKNGFDYRKFKIYEEVFKAKRKDEVVELLNKSFKEVFNEKDIGEYYFKAIRDMKNFFHIFRYDVTGLKRKFYKFANIFASRLFRDVRYLSYNFPLDNSEYYLNLNNQEWYNLADKSLKSHKSVLELYDMVVKDAVSIVEKVYDYIFKDKDVDLEKLYGNKSYGDGKVLK